MSWYGCLVEKKLIETLMVKMIKITKPILLLPDPFFYLTTVYSAHSCYLFSVYTDVFLVSSWLNNVVKEMSKRCLFSFLFQKNILTCTMCFVRNFLLQSLSGMPVGDHAQNWAECGHHPGRIWKLAACLWFSLHFNLGGLGSCALVWS